MIKFSLAALALTAAVGCGSDKKDTPAATTTPVTLAQAQAALTKNCVAAGCHDKNHASAGASSDFTAVTDASLKGTTALSDISTGRMPQAGSTQAASFTAADKTTLVNYLNGK